MKLRFTILPLFILSLAVTGFGQAAKIEGYVSNEKGIRVAGVRIVVTPGGQSSTTDSKGHFTISLPDNVQPGQPAQIRVDRVGWVIFNPMFGKCETKSVARNFEPLAVMIVLRASPFALSPNRLSKVIAQWAAERVKLRTEVGQLKQELDEYAFIQEYALEYGFSLDQFRAAADEWAQIKDSDDKEERARKAYWQKNYGNAAQLAGESAQAAVEELRQAKKTTGEASLKVIRRYKLKGNALYADYKFSEALAAYGEIEKCFETRQISKDDFAEAWADLQVLIGNTRGESGIRVGGAAGPQLLREALVAFRQAQTFYTHDQLPQQWATTQNNLGNVLSELGERSEGDESLGYLKQAEAAYRAALEVRTRAQFQQEWAMTQDNRGTVLRSLGVRSAGSDSTKYLTEALTAHRAALEVEDRARFPQQWAHTQNNLGTVLSDLGERSEGNDGIKYLSEAMTAYRAAQEVFTRALWPQQWAATQHNIGVVLADLSDVAKGDERIAYLNQAVAAYRVALEVRLREQLPQQWAMTENNLGTVLRSLGAQAKESEGIRYFNEAVAAYRAALEVTTRAQFPQRWAGTQHNLGVAFGFLGERYEGSESIRYLNQAMEAYRAALEVRTRAHFPPDWAQTQNSLGILLRNLGLRSEGDESLQYLNQAAAAHRAALEVFTRTQFPLDWGSTQNNLGNLLSDLGERTEGSGKLKYLNEAASAYRAALEVGTRAQFPRLWAATQNNLAMTYMSLGDWGSASEAYANVLQVYPDNAKAYSRAALLYHERLFQFEKAFALHNRWLAEHKGDVAVQADFAETHLTTSRFSECEKRISTLLAYSGLPYSTKTALRVIEIASMLALDESKQVSAKLDVLIADVDRQPPAFTVEWGFDGTRYFIDHSEKLSARRAWLAQLLDALAAKDRDSMLKALREARTAFKD